MTESFLNIAKVILAFGFVIFWHELGHFLAARWAKVRVEQFAVGMGQALISFRKGIGFRWAGFGSGGHWGSTQDEFDKRVREEFARRASTTGENPNRELSIREQYDIAKSIGIGETEYRLSWIPIGGYVKPSGQDDLRPAKDVLQDDPHSYGAKSVGKRMVIISAGVIMNVILAFALNVALFVYGFNTPPATIGFVSAGSPAQQAGLQVGDTILTINGTPQEDFTKVQMNISLLRDDEPSTFVVRRPGVTEPVTLKIQPVRSETTSNMPGIGIGPCYSLAIPKDAKAGDALSNLELDKNSIIAPGSAISKVNGQSVDGDGYYVLDRAIQSSGGKPVDIEVQSAENTTESRQLQPEFSLVEFGNTKSLGSIAGVRPRIKLDGIAKNSLAGEKGLKKGDVIEQISVNGTGEVLAPPTHEQFREWIKSAGANKRSIEFIVSNNGVRRDPVTIAPADSKVKDYVIGVAYYDSYDLDTNIVGDVAKDSPFDKSGLKKNEQILSIAGASTQNWYEILESLRKSSPGEIAMTIQGLDGKRDTTLNLDAKTIAQLNSIRYSSPLVLAPMIKTRRTTSPATLLSWSWTETKFSIIQVYLTLQRLVQGTVPLGNLSGPLGIVSAGSSAAERGFDWLLWFTALISANLAVVNFLPIPIVDGGHFMFLLSEKITGKPPSPRVQAVAQVIGLVLLGSLFLFVTYHDILRQWG